MEILVALLLKFMGVIYGTVYGLVSSIPFIKEWIALSKIDVVAQEGEVRLVNAGHGALVVIDGHVVWDGGDLPIQRRVLRHRQVLALTNRAHGDTRIWLAAVDVTTGKELTIVKRVVLAAAVG